MDKDCMSLQDLIKQCREKLIEICNYQYTEKDGLAALNTLKATCETCRWNKLTTCCDTKRQLNAYKNSIQYALSALTREAGAVQYRHVQLGPIEFHNQVVPGAKNEMVARMHELLTEIIDRVNIMKHTKKW